MNLEKQEKQGSISDHFKAFRAMSAQQMAQSWRRSATHGLAAENFTESHRSLGKKDFETRKDVENEATESVREKIHSMSDRDLIAEYFRFDKTRTDGERALGKIMKKYQEGPYGVIFIINALREELKQRGMTEEQFTGLEERS